MSTDPPPLSALDALARLQQTGSIAAAAEVMNLTPGAVSHKLKAAERRLGFPLTEARGRGVVLTRRAERYLDEIRPALEALTRATRRARDEEAGAALRVAAPPGLAASWLAPRLHLFHAAHPHIDLTLAPGGAADAVIAFRRAPEAGEIWLATPRFHPVAAPAAAYGAEAPKTPADLARRRLLHLYDRDDWRGWAAAANAPGLADQAEATTFTDANLLFAAAAAGLGVALGDDITCSAALASGALVPLFRERTTSDRSYYLSHDGGDAAVAFADWVTEALGA